MEFLKSRNVYKNSQIQKECLKPVLSFLTSYVEKMKGRDDAYSVSPTPSSHATTLLQQAASMVKVCDILIRCCSASPVKIEAIKCCKAVCRSFANYEDGRFLQCHSVYSSVLNFHSRYSYRSTGRKFNTQNLLSSFRLHPERAAQ